MDRPRVTTPIKLMGLGVTLLHALFSLTLIINLQMSTANAISIKPADFDRLIMPCYLGGSSYQQQASSFQQPSPSSSGGPSGVPSSYTQLGRITAQGVSMGGSNGNNYQSSSYYATSVQGRDTSDNLGQQVPRANTIDNFIALLTKIETASPRLANNPDQLIRVLLNRFRMDNYYYDVRSKIPISEQDLRTQNIIPALLGTLEQSSSFFGQSDDERFSEFILNQDEKCSMYFMLSHFIDKATPMNLPLASIPVPQMSGPQYGIKPPNLQAAGSGYPGVSANNAFSGAGVRYPGPSPSFGSPVTNNMNSFGSGMSNNRDYSSSNPYGMNVVQPNNQLNINYNNMRNMGPYSGTATSNFRQSSPIIDGQARSGREQFAVERGVVALQGQENAAVVLNRVLLGILAATAPQRTIRQLAEIIFPNQALTSSSRIDNDIDPLFAVTLADLWAVSSIPKNGKPFDLRTLGDNGRWNDTMCQTTFHLERASSIKFTTAELLGGLDGFNLGMLRRELINMRKNVRLSDMFRMYYSKTGFKNQFAEVGVCNRVLALNNHIETLKRQSEDYSRLYQLNLPVNDNEIVSSISRLESFKELVRQSANQYAPQDLCQESSYDGFSVNMQDQCEVGKADVVTILDTSPQANDAFQRMSIIKLAQKLGLSRSTNSLTILTNQQDTTGSSGGNGFNTIVSNSTNTGEIGCALMHDTSRSYSGGQISEATKLVEMFEKALINLDSEYLARQNVGYSSNREQSSYSSSWFGSGDGSRNSYQELEYTSSRSGGPKSTGGAKVIVWFNFGQQIRMNSLASYPTNMHGSQEQSNYRFQEAKKYLRENFRGASILAVASNRDDVKAFVYDENKDIITDIPNGASTSMNEYYPSLNVDSSSTSGLGGSADQLVGKLLQRMCEIPALFQYPMCFKSPSENIQSVGFISPQKKQYWMMSPKTFFASQSVRLAFRVDGGRLRVCFGRKPKPDESAQKKGQVYESSSTYLTSSDNRNSASTPAPSYGDNFYTGADYGVCKDVSAGQEVDFVIDSPCYKTSIADCDPFYIVLKENSNPGDSDPNYMCKDEGCKRFDQVKFTMRHTGVSCNSAASLTVNMFLIMISAIVTWCFAGNGSVGLMSQQRKVLRATKWSCSAVMVCAVSFVYMGVQQVQAQQAGVHDFGQGRYGEKRGNFTPSEMLAIILLIMTLLAGLALTIGLCYYVSKQSTRGRTRVEQNDY